MNVVIISCFRNAAHYIPRYFDQVQQLRKLLLDRGDWLSLLLGYGDSTDGTDVLLHEETSFAIGALLVDVSHGGPRFGSIEHPTRFKQLAKMGNTLLECVSPDADVVGFLESDLIWDAPTLLALIDHLQHVPAIAPMIMDGPNSFYDVFAYRKNSVRFTKQPPFHRELNRTLTEIDSAGSVIFADAYLARKARLSDGEAIVGWCNGIREQGGSIWVDPTLTVKHPPYG